MRTTPKIPEIREEELTPSVTALVEIMRIQQEQIQELRDEIARLKGQKPKPKIKPSVLTEKDGILEVGLESLGFKDRHIRIATEAALLGSIQRNKSINPDLVILSDDTGQFEVLRRAQSLQAVSFLPLKGKQRFKSVLIRYSPHERSMKD
ncbi:MAG: hypothetical protein WC647_09940 [Desulfomonilaceae bacterium]|jgi:hypothetical protein